MTQDELKQILFYCAITGHFTWLVTNSNRAKCGTRAGSSQKTGHRHISINGKLYLEHRLAWLYVHGYFPSKQIDHKNGDPSDNRIDNLREATSAENSQNQKMSIKNTSGFTGVSWNRENKKWIAKIKKDGKSMYIGSFTTPEEAHQAYLQKKKELHTFNPIPR